MGAARSRPSAYYRACARYYITASRIAIMAVLQRRPLVIGNDAISQSEFCQSELCQSWLIFKIETSKRHQIPTTNACKNFSCRGLRIKIFFIPLDFRDSTLTYAQELIFGLTDHSTIVCDSTFVTISCDRQKIQTSQQRPTQYAHTGDFTIGAARSRPSAYLPGLRPVLKLVKTNQSSINQSEFPK